MSQLVKAIYVQAKGNPYVVLRPFQLEHQQWRAKHHRKVQEARWYNQHGQYLGMGDLAHYDLANVAKNILPDDLKVIADSAKLINHQTAKHFPPPKQTIMGDIDAVTEPNPEIQQEISQITITMQSSGESQKLLAIKKLIEAHPGSTPLLLHFVGQNQKLKIPGGVEGSQAFLEALYEITGQGNVEIKKAPTKVGA